MPMFAKLLHERLEIRRVIWIPLVTLQGDIDQNMATITSGVVVATGHINADAFPAEDKGSVQHNLFSLDGLSIFIAFIE